MHSLWARLFWFEANPYEVSVAHSELMLPLQGGWWKERGEALVQEGVAGTDL